MMGMGMRMGRRSGGGAVWTPADIGAGLVDYYDAAEVTLAAGTDVAAMTGLANGVHLAQSNAALQPEHVATGSPSGLPVIRFDGTALLKTATITLAQPVVFVASIKWTEWIGSGNQYIIDGDTADAIILYRSGGTKLYAGTGLLFNPQPTDATWYVWEALADGATSAAAFDGAARTTGNAGANASNGLTLGARANASNFTKIDVARIILMSRDFTDAAERANAVAWCQAGI